MEQIMVNFLWQKGHGRRGIHWCEWKRLCELKESSGLGYCCLANFNLALLAKQGWRLFDNPNSLLARTLKAKYYPNFDFLNSKLGNIPSYTWKSIWAAKGLLLSGLCWRVGTGRDIKIEEDVWVPDAEGLLIKRMGEPVGEFTVRSSYKLLLQGAVLLWHRYFLKISLEDDS
ncbi:hypothetical protein J1N35_007541 [Gossypium stocksii]|uniref:Reverse transcriptase zinc-binding domain-containing protein n=1 Tax=Gossypium stocksii TaxID=47602 RepID=A0A9D4AFN5_9ROSI|nr:hypothetical protein J1N35_007541 [Gossypium stocksii]